MSVTYHALPDKIRSYWITYAQRLSNLYWVKTVKTCENIGSTFDNVDENIENSVITPAGICPP